MMGLFLLVTASRRALGSILAPIQFVSREIRPWREANHSLPSSAEVKNSWSYTSIPPVGLHGAWCLVKQEMYVSKSFRNESIAK